MTARHLLSWKALFYGATLPALRRLGPARADAALGAIGQAIARADPGRVRRIAARLVGSGLPFDSRRDLDATARAVAANVPRYLARDYPLDGLTDAEALARFDVTGAGHLDAGPARGRGLVLVGSHYGAHVAGLHWLARRPVPARMMVQRPNHASTTLLARFDAPAQARLSLRRGLPTAEAADRILRAHAALRAGLIVTLSGDIPWPGPNARPGRLLGVDRPFLSVWADLAALARSPVAFLTCRHAPGGRYELSISEPIEVRPGSEAPAVAAFLAGLDAAIAADPAGAVAHLTWPCFGPSPTPLPCQRPRKARLLSPRAESGRLDRPGERKYFPA